MTGLFGTEEPIGRVILWLGELEEAAWALFPLRGGEDAFVDDVDLAGEFADFAKLRGLEWPVSDSAGVWRSIGMETALASLLPVFAFFLRNNPKKPFFLTGW